MINIAKVIIKDNASYVVISITPFINEWEWQPHLFTDYWESSYHTIPLMSIHGIPLMVYLYQHYCAGGKT